MPWILPIADVTGATAGISEASRISSAVSAFLIHKGTSRELKKLTSNEKRVPLSKMICFRTLIWSIGTLWICTSVTAWTPALTVSKSSLK